MQNGRRCGKDLLDSPPPHWPRLCAYHIDQWFKHHPEESYKPPAAGPRKAHPDQLDLFA